MNLNKNKACILCNKKKFKKIYIEKGHGVNNYNFLEYCICLNCSFISKKKNSVTIKNNFYKNRIYFNSIKINKNLLNRFESINKIIKKYHHNPYQLKIFDYGCGPGHFVKFLIKKKYKKVSAFDVYTILENKKTNIKFYHNINKIKTKFDVIVLNHVLEHIENPLKCLNFLIKKLLKKEGLLICEVPNSDLLRIDNLKPSSFVKEHYNQFNFNSLTKLILKLNLYPLEINSISDNIQSRDPYMPVLILVAKKNKDYSNPHKLLKTIIKKQTKQKKILNKYKNKKIAIIGCGDGLDYLVNQLRVKNISNIYDNNKNLIGMKKFNFIIQNPTNLLKNKDEYFIISSLNYYNKIYLTKQLKKIDSKAKIIDLNA